MRKLILLTTVLMIVLMTSCESYPWVDDPPEEVPVEKPKDKEEKT